jgi:hypothetical protein
MDLDQDIDQLQDKLRNFGEGAKWLLRGQFLQQARDAREWDKRGAHTFGNFVRDVAGRLGMKEAMVWRDLKVYTYYTSLQKQGHAVLDADTLLQRSRDGRKIVGSGHLDALQRLEQTMSAAEFNEIVTELFHTSEEGPGLSRAQLEQRWLVLRDALKGPTPRGRNENKLELIQGRKNERQALQALMESGGAWLSDLHRRGGSDAEIQRYELFFEVKAGKQYVDAIAVVLGNWSPTVEFHGIEVSREPADILKLLHDPDCIDAFDYFWVAIPHDVHPLIFMQIESLESTGIIQFSGDRFCIEREASLQPDGPTRQKRTGELAKTLLAQKLKRPTA